MIGHDSAAAESVTLRRACEQLGRRLRSGQNSRAEEFLAADAALRADPDAELELIYTEFVVREELGQQPRPEEWLARFPHLRDELAQVFAMDRLVSSGQTQDRGLSGTHPGSTDDPNGANPSSTQPGPGVFVGNYEVLEEIGRGGMGVVYKARQRGLERLVALKTIPAPHEPRERTRFQTEAQATARLSHPNIVQVYEVGQDDGCPFLSMELVPGASLDKQIAQTPLASRAAAELLLALAQAVAYAHQQGIVHRDLKPANILLAPDRTPKITDFGLARLLSPANGSPLLGANATQTGVMAGTPSYMAPEQCGGPRSAIGPLVDVYALGVILYEALTGRPPFRGETVLDTLELVRSQEPVPLRRLAPKVPRDLETICLKCLAKQPHRRYASAVALAEDLQRFLAGRPIAARRISTLERTGRWCRRSPLVAALAASLAVALLAGIGGILWQWRRADAHARQALVSAEEERAARELAEYRFGQAEKAVGDYLDSIENNERLKEADFFDLRKQLLTSAVPFYEDFVRQKPAEASLEAKRGRAYQRLGSLRRQLGEREQAVADYQHAQAIFQMLASEFPNIPKYRQEQGRCHHALGNLCRELGNLGEAVAEVRQAVALQEALVAELPADPAYRQDLAKSRHNLGLLLNGLGNHEEAAVEYQQVFSIKRPLVADFPTVPEYRLELARTHNNLAKVLSDLGKRSEAIEEMRQALILQKTLVAEFPKVAEYRQALSLSHNNLGGLFSQLRKWSEAETEHRQAIALYDSLASDFPTIPAYRQDSARAHYDLARVLRDAKKLDVAEAEYRRALEQRTKLNSDFPELPECRADLAESHAGLGSLFSARTNRAQAIEELQRAREIWTSLVAQFDAVPAFRRSMASHMNTLAILLRDDGKFDEARTMHHLAIEHGLKLLEGAPNHRNYAASLASYYFDLAATLLHQEDHAAVAIVVGRLRQLRPEVASDTYWAARYLGRCVTLAEQDAQLKEPERQALARSYADQAMDDLREAVRRGQSNVAEIIEPPALASLHSRPDFQSLVKELESRSANRP